MKIFYDSNSRTITIENVNKYFSSGSLISTVNGNNISINYADSNKLEIFDHFSIFKKQDGSPAGNNANDVSNYLNEEFNKGIISGISSFSGLSSTKTINDSRIKIGDVIFIQGIGVLNEVLGVSVSNGVITVNRSVIVTLTGLTSNLQFNWIRI